MMKHVHLLAVLAMSLTTSHALADEYTYEFTKTVISGEGQQDLNGINWTLSTNGGYFGYDSNRGQQIGSGAQPAKTATLSTSDISGTITSVEVTTCGAKSIEGNLDVTIGGKPFGQTYTLTSTPMAATFAGSASGEIKLNYTQTSSKALYIKAIKVTYTPGSNPGTGTTTIPTVESIAAFNALADGTEARLYLSSEAQARVTHVYGTNAYIRDNSGAICFYGFAKKPDMAYNQHVAGYITGQKSSVGNLPVLLPTARTNTTLLVIAEPVTEPDVEPILITSAEQTQHYADWVTIKDVTMTDAMYGHDAAGMVRIVNSFNAAQYITPVAGTSYTFSGIVNSTASDGDRLSPIYNKPASRRENPTFIPGSEILPVAVATGIGGITTETSDTAAPAYDLMGRRVNLGNMPKGIYIVNGKKYVK